MKKFLITAALFLGATAAATAADFPATPMPTKVAMPAPILFSWTGCYIGIEGGGNWGRSEQISKSGPFIPASITGQFNLSGGIAGGTIGCNVQTSNFVIGIENDFSWTNKKGSAFNLLPFDPTTTSSTREKWIDTLRGRFGYTPWERFMIYGTAGVAFANTEVSVSNPAFVTLTDSQIRPGWVAGLGGEWAAWSGPFGDVTFKAEWLHASFTSHNYFDPQVTASNGQIVVTRSLKLSDDMFRVGVNLKFNPWSSPVVARY
jgi:outer membrane immunogenic protein